MPKLITENPQADRVLYPVSEDEVTEGIINLNMRDGGFGSNTGTGSIEFRNVERPKGYNDGCSTVPELDFRLPSMLTDASIIVVNPNHKNGYFSHNGGSGRIDYNYTNSTTETQDGSGANNVKGPKKRTIIYNHNLGSGAFGSNTGSGKICFNLPPTSESDATNNSAYVKSQVPVRALPAPNNPFRQKQLPESLKNREYATCNQRTLWER